MSSLLAALQPSTTPCRSAVAAAACLLANLALAAPPLAAPAAPSPPTGPAAALARLTGVECPNFAAMVSHYGVEFGSRMTRWSAKELPDAGARPVLYLFSGPDIVTAMAMFPGASHLTLVADQQPEYSLLSEPAVEQPAQQARECDMLAFFGRRGYYRTDDLNGKGGARPRFIKLLAYSLAFGGASVSEADLLTIGADGTLAARLPGRDGPAPQGVRFVGRRADGSALTVDYLAIDLADHGLSRDPAATQFLARNARDVLFLKSASHLLQSPHFGRLANLLMNPPAPLVVQDETGLGIDRLREVYRLTLYGKFVAPQRLWAASPSARALAEEYRTQPAGPDLPFTIGYEKKAGSALLVGRHRSP
jgi:hypothetical protein